MKKTSVYLNLFRGILGGAALGALLLSGPAPSVLAADIAIVVGVNHYDPDYMEDNDLRGCVPDSEHVQAMLEKDPFHDWQILRLNDEAATKDVVRALMHLLADPSDAEAIAALEEVFSENSGEDEESGDESGEEGEEGGEEGGGAPAGQISAAILAAAPAIQEFLASPVALGDGDYLLYYHSSHGGNHLDPYQKSVCLCLHDGSYNDSEIAADLIRFAPGVKILSVIDTCHSGGLDPQLITTPRPVLASVVAARLQEANVSLANMGWIAAAPFDNVSYDSEDGGEFTVSFLAAINDGVGDDSVDLNGDNQISAYEAWRHAFGDRNVRSVPQISNESLCEQFRFSGFDAVLDHYEIGGPASIIPGRTEVYTLYAVYGYTTAAESPDDDEEDDSGDGEDLDPDPGEGETAETVFVETDRVPVSGASWSATLDGATASITADGVLACPASATAGSVYAITATGLDAGVAVENSPFEVSVEEEVSYAEALDNVFVDWMPAPGDAEWYGQRAVSSDDEDALVSGYLSDAGSSVFSGTFSGSGLLTFRYLVEGGNASAFVVTADGVESLRVVGATEDWQTASLLFGAGNHTVLFTYTRAVGDRGRGQNRAWVDQVRFSQGNYSADMNANDQGWKTGGTAGLWQRGVPTFGPVDGRTCWGTVLDGRYPSEANGWLVSPPIPVGRQATLAFSTWFDIDNTAWQQSVEASGGEFADGWKTYLDGGFIEVSTQNGGWSNITAAAAVPGNASTDTVAGQSGDWVVATAPLPEWAVGKTVRIRFRFASDSFVAGVGNPAGWFVDDVSVFSANDDDIALRGVLVEDTAIGNANGIVEPGETVWVSFSAVNQGDTDRAGVVGSVVCTTPGVTLAESPARVTYGDIPSFSAADGAPRLLVQVADTVAEGTVVRLVQTLTDASGGRWEAESTFVVRSAAAWSGTVAELAEPDAPVPSDGALVTISGGSGTYATLTSGGAFSFAAVPAGEYSIAIAKAGFSDFGPETVSVVDGGTADFTIGRAFAVPSVESFLFDPVESTSSIDAVLTLCNGGATPGTVPATFTVLFPDGQPDWLAWELAEGIIPACTADGESRTIDLRFTINGDGLLTDHRTNAVVRIVSNDCEGRSPQDIPITLVASLDYLSVTACHSYDNPSGTADADGYLERGEDGFVWFSFANRSSASLLNLVVESAKAVNGPDGSDFASVVIDTDAVQAIVPSIGPSAESFSVPAIPASLPAVDIEDPWYDIEVVLRDPESMLASVSTNRVVFHDRHSVSGTVYTAIQAITPVQDVLLRRYVYTLESLPTDPEQLAELTPDEAPVASEEVVAPEDYENYPKVTVLQQKPVLDGEGNETGDFIVAQVQLETLVTPVAVEGGDASDPVVMVSVFTLQSLPVTADELDALTPDDGYPVDVVENNVDPVDYVDYPKVTVLDEMSFLDEEGVETGESCVIQVQMDKFVVFRQSYISNAVLRVTTYTADEGMTLDVSDPPASLQADSSSEVETLLVEDVDPAEIEAEYPKLEVLETDGEENPLVATYTELVEFRRIPRTSTQYTIEPQAEAVVFGVGNDDLVETVSLEDGTYVLHGLRNGYGKVYAVPSALFGDGIGTGYSEDLEAQGIQSIPVVFDSLPDGLPDFEAGEGVDLYLIGALESPILKLFAVSPRDENGNGVFEPGEGFTFSGTVANVGTSIAKEITLEFSCLFPEGLDDTTWPSATFGSETLAFEDANLNPGRTMPFTVVGNVFGDVPGTASILVKMTAVDAEGVARVWWGTFDLVSQGFAFSGTVYLDDEPYGGARLIFETLDADGEVVSTMLSWSLDVAPGPESRRGTYSFTLRNDFDCDVRIRVQPAAAFLPENLEILLPGPQTESQSELDFHLVSTGESGGGSGTLSLSARNPDGSTGDTLLLTHSEGQSTNAVLVIENGTANPVTINHVVVRYNRLPREYGQGVGVARRSALAAPADEEAESPDDPVDLADIVPGECFVTFRSGLDEAAQEALVAPLGATIARRYLVLKSVLCRFPVPEGEDGRDAFLRLRAALLATGEVLKVEPARVIRMEPTLFSDVGTPNDRYIDDQWALLNERQTGGSWGADINVAPLWERGWVGTRDVIVAVQDTGVDIDHPDLIPNLWTNAGEIPGNGEDDDGNGYVDDVYGWNFALYNNEVDDPPAGGHGTHVAGIIGAAGDNATGVAGVNWRVRILPIRIADDDGGLSATSPHVAESFDYMVQCGASVVNCSWGSTVIFTEPIVAEAIKTACDTYGLLLVTSAGNDAMDNDRYHTSLSGLKGSVNNVIVVAAADHDGKVAEFTNYGAQSVDIAAPGVDVLSTYLFDAGGYETMDGTSMASPYVAGAAALLKSICPGATMADIRKAILDGARRDPNLAGWVATSGHLDVAAAAEYLGSDWLVPVDGSEGITIAAGESAEIAFDVNPALRLRAGEYTATIDIDYVSGSTASTLSVPAVDTVTAAPYFVVDAVAVDDSASGDGDGFAEPGETVGLILTVRNAGSQPLKGVSGAVSGASSGWPTLPFAGAAANTNLLQVAMPGAEGDAEFTLTLSGTAAGAPVTVSVPFIVPVAARASVVGTVRNTAGGAIAGAPVEFWTDGTPADADTGASLAGRVLADASGAYRVDGLLPGARVALRAIPAGYARSDVVVRTASGGATVSGVNFSLPATVVWFPGLPVEGVEKTLLPGTSASQTISVTNVTTDALAWRAVPIARKRVLLLSDTDSLNSLAPVVEKLGFDVDVISGNYECVNVGYGSYQFQNEEHVGQSLDDALLLGYDFVVADFDGDRGGGRQLTDGERDSLRAYLDRGGRLLVTGGSLLAMPDNDVLADLVGASEFRRRTADELIPAVFADVPADLPQWTVAGATSSFAEVANTHPYGASLPNTGSEADAFVVDDTAQVLLANADASDGTAQPKLVAQSVGTGTLYYWGGSVAAADLAPRGVLQDILRDILYAELLEPVDWVSVPASGTFAARATSSVSVSIDASDLPLGTHEASLVFFGAFADAETEPVRIVADVIQPSFAASSTLGVTNAFGAFLKGDGQDGSCVYQLIATTAAGGAVSPPRASDGMPSGADEVVVASASTGLFYGRFGVNVVEDRGLFSDIFEIPYTGADTWVVVRAWNGPSVGGAIWYGDSEPYKLSFEAGENHDFGKWCVGTVFNYPAADGTQPLDTNGDGIPDGYVLENFPGVDPAAAPEAETGMEFINKIQQASVASMQQNAKYYPYRVFATDRYVYALNGGDGQKCLTVWNTNGLTGTPVGTFRPTGTLQFQSPCGMGRQPGANRLAVADTGRHVVHVFDFNESLMSQDNVTPGFTHVLTIGVTDKAQAQGGVFTAPQGVAMDAEGAIYVVDTGSGNALQGRRVLVFNPDGSLRNEFQPSGESNLIAPAGIDVDPASGDIYVANTGAGNIVRLPANGEESVVYYNSSDGDEPADATLFAGPTDVKVWTVGSTFRLVVADRDGNGVHVLNSEGRVIATFTNSLDATIYVKDGKFRKPWGVYPVDESDEIWVADTRNNRLQHLRFTLDGDGDGIDDTQEMLNGLDPLVANDADSDGDGLYDSAEIVIGTDPFNPDTDNGGVNDGDEVNAGLNPLDPADDTAPVTLTVAALPTEGGTVSGAGTYAIGTEVQITATPSAGWQFAGWQDDGSTDSPRTVKVAASGNAYTALFERQSFLVVVNYVTTNDTASAIVPGGTETFERYYGILFHQDRTALFIPPYSFDSGSDSLGTQYATPVIDFAADGPETDVDVTFIVLGGGEAPDEPEAPILRATAIAVTNNTLTATFETNATEESQFGAFMNDERTATTMLVAETLDELAAFRDWKAANPGVARSAYTGTLHEMSVTVTEASASAPFTFSIEADVSSWTADSLFIIGFDKP